jgi:Flp pilus assembly protein TadD
MPRPLLILLALAALTIGAYWQVGDLGFVSYDDTSYVSMQPMVNQGLREAAVYWAFSATHGANWHPLTSLSHMFDCTIFGGRPAPLQDGSETARLAVQRWERSAASAMHWENVAWHVLNTCLVFWVWWRLSGAASASAFVAALFALHPLHVESVAWISERKDVLSTACWLFTLLAYLRWVERPTRGRYAWIALGTALALLAKPMTVTLPCTLLLLDYWPLRRWPQKSWGALLVEKLPLFALVAVLCVTTVIVQHAEGATDYGEKVNYGMRVGNAFVSYARYLGKMFWPDQLSCFYPHPGWWPWWAILGSVVLFGALSWLAWRERERRPWLTFGWCWYLGTLVPVIGLMQVGAQSMADRYTYVPLLGIFTAIAWAGVELAERQPRWQTALTVAAVVVLSACTVRTWQQIPIWNDGWRLLSHALKVVGEHVIVRRELAKALIVEGRPEEKVNEQYQLGLKIDPNDAYFMTELGFSAARAKRWDEALTRLEKARAMVPKEAGTYGNLGNFFLMKGDLDQSLEYLRKGVALNPKLSSLHRLVGQVYVKQNRMTEARDSLETAVRVDRWDWRAHNDLGVVYTRLDRFSDGIASLEYAEWINPTGSGVEANLQGLRERMGLSVQ